YLDTPEDFHKAIDGFFLPSRYEGFSVAVLEAMACNLPLILSDGPGNAQMARLPLSHCICLPVGDREAFARAVDDWSDQQPCEPNHRRIAQQRFNEMFNYQRMFAIYRRLVMRARGHRSAAHA